MNTYLLIFTFIVLISHLAIISSITFKSFLKTESMLSFKVADVEKFETESEKYNYNITNVYFLQPICESTDIDTPTNYKNSICLMTAIMNVLIIPKEKINSLEYHFQLNQLIIDYNYTTMNFKIESNELHYEFTLDIATVGYNKFLPVFSSSFSTEMLPVFDNKIPPILDQLYQKEFNTVLKIATSSYPILSTVFNLIQLDKERYYINEELDTDVDHQVTYCYFTTPTLLDFFFTGDKEVPEKIKVNFDYSVNYNLNYQNGSFVIYDVSFQKYGQEIMKYENDKDSFEPTNEYPLVKEKIMSEFKTVLIDSLTQYYAGNKVANSDSVK